MDSANLFWSRPHCGGIDDYSLSANPGSKANHALIVLLRHGDRLSFAGNSGHKPPGFVLWNYLASKRYCDFCHADYVAIGQCRCPILVGIPETKLAFARA